MGTKVFSFTSQAKYRSGGHFKEKADILSLANQEIMVDDKGSHFKAMFPDILADYQNPPLTGDIAMANKAWQIIWRKSHRSQITLSTEGISYNIARQVHLTPDAFGSLRHVRRILQVATCEKCPQARKKD